MANWRAVSTDDLPVLAFPSAGAFAAWLKGRQATSEGVWLKLAKLGAPAPTVSYAEALDVALCHGWIDGQKGGLDDQYWLQKFTPRRPGSRWSKINRDKALSLIDQGKMQPAGLREVERAKADGRWDAAYEGQRIATVPEDLRLALDKNEGRASFSRPSTAATDTRSSTECTMPRSQRRGLAASSNSWRCSASTGRSIRLEVGSAETGLITGAIPPPGLM